MTRTRTNSIATVANKQVRRAVHGRQHGRKRWTCTDDPPVKKFCACAPGGFSGDDDDDDDDDVDDDDVDDDWQFPLL